MEYQWYKKTMPHIIEISQAVNGGYIVKLGCIQLAYGHNETGLMSRELHAYLMDPEKVEKVYHAEHMTMAGPEVATEPTEFRGLDVKLDVDADLIAPDPNPVGPWRKMNEPPGLCENDILKDMQMKEEEELIALTGAAARKVLARDKE